MSEQTLEQRRAKHALACVNSVVGTSYGNYKSYTKALPANILMSGLGQAVATVRSRRDRAGYPQLYEHIAGWLCGDDEDAPYRNYPENDLIKAIVENDQDHYIRAQAEAMAYLEWLRKFAEAFLEDGREVG